MTYLLDTSVWLRGVLELATIPEDVQRILRQPNERFAVSAISLWEVGKKNQIGKIRLKKDLDVWFRDALRPEIDVLGLSPEIVVDAMRLEQFPTRDPADELIVATSRIYDLTLLTSDTALRGYRHARIKYFKPISTEID